MPDINIILDNLYQLSDAEARRIMHTALCAMPEIIGRSKIAHYLNTAADGKLG